MNNECRPKFGMSRIWRFICRGMRNVVGWVMSKLRITRIRPGMRYDPATGNTIDVYVGSVFVRISFNGRDYFYYTVTGKFDGTGSRVFSN